MKNLNKKIFALSVSACCLYAGFLAYDIAQNQNGAVPTIQAPAESASFSVKASPEDLTQGLTASDEEDGDLASRIFVESISPMDENNQRTVTYGVFDSDDHVARTSRKIQYTDYAPPKFTIKKPLMYATLDSFYDMQAFVGAESVLDGDISDKVVMEGVEEQGDIYLANFTVSDSAGRQEKITLKANPLKNEPSFQIELSQNLIRVAPGTAIDARAYIKNISMMNMDYNDLIPKVEIRTDYNPQVPGMYEFIYQLQRPNGDFGTTKLVVIVE